jgi:hypothetical protein
MRCLENEILVATIDRIRAQLHCSFEFLRDR